MKSICDECAKKEGLIPKDKAACWWVGFCDFCEEDKEVTGRRDYKRPGQRPITMVEFYIEMAYRKDK